MKIRIIFFALLVFIFSLSLRLWNIHDSGRWWDEEWYVQKGYYFVELLKKGDWTNPYFYVNGGDHPPLSTYFYGLASYKDLISYDSSAKPILPVLNVPKGSTVFSYNLV